MQTISFLFLCPLLIALSSFGAPRFLPCRSLPKLLCSLHYPSLQVVIVAAGFDTRAYRMGLAAGAASHPAANLGHLDPAGEPTRSNNHSAVGQVTAAGAGGVGGEADDRGSPPCSPSTPPRGGSRARGGPAQLQAQAARGVGGGPGGAGVQAARTQSGKTGGAGGAQGDSGSGGCGSDSGGQPSAVPREGEVGTLSSIDGSGSFEQGGGGGGNTSGDGSGGDDVSSGGSSLGANGGGGSVGSGRSCLKFFEVDLPRASESKQQLVRWLGLLQDGRQVRHACAGVAACTNNDVGTTLLSFVPWNFSAPKDCAVHVQRPMHAYTVLVHHPCSIHPLSPGTHVRRC